MALEQNKIQYLDTWDDVKEHSKKKHEAAEKEKDQHNVTKSFVNEQISSAEKKDNEEEQAEYAKIYQKIDDISAGGGADLTPYLKKTEAAETYATKSEIPSVSGYATTEYVNQEIARVEEEIPEMPDLSDYAKKSDIPDVSSFVTEETVDEKVATEIAKVVADAPEDFDTLKEVADYIASDKTKAAEIETAISNLQSGKADAYTVYTKEQADAKFLTEHQDLTDYAKKTDIPSVENLATKAEVEAVDEKVDAIVIPDVSNFATKDEIPSIEGLVTEQQMTAALEDKATIAQVSAIDQKVDAIVIPDTSAFITEEALEPYALKTDLPDTSNFATKAEVDAVEAQIPSVEGFATTEQLTAAVSDKATITQVAEVEAQIPDVSNLATKTEVEAGDASVLNNVLGKMWNKGSDCFYTKKTVNGKTAIVFNEEDGGGSIYETSDLKSFVGVNDGGDVSTGVHVQIYSKSKADNKGARLNVNPTGIFYSVGTSAEITPEKELAVKGDIPSIEGLATTEQLNDAVDVVNVELDKKADTVDVSTAVESIETSLETKAEAAEVPTKTEFEALKGKFEELKQLVYEYAPGSEQEAIADGEIADLSPDNKSVHVEEPMKSVVLPESTGTLYTVEVPLRDESSVELTSSKTATIANTSDEPVNTTFTAPEPTGSSNTRIYLSGLFENIEITNVNIDKSSSYDAAIISGNVTITEANTKPVTVSAEFSNGCVVKNESDCEVTLSNKSAVGSSVTILAPGSTVTIQGGQWEELDSTVSDTTLYINNSAHIKKLILNKGNVVVNSYAIENCIDEVVNETEYTVSPKVIEVTSKTEWNKASSVDALYEIQNDISTNIRIAPGIFGSQAKMKLNGYTVDCTDANGAFVLRGSSHYIIENGTINASAYGIWLAGAGTVELKDVHIIANNHALYIEKTGGNIYTTGNCRFEVSNDDKRYVANYLDATYTGGWTHGFHFGENTEFVDFDPAASMGEVGGPVNLLDDGYHTESYTEGEHTIYKVVKDSE